MLFKSHPAASLKEIKKHLRLAIHGHVISDIKKQTFHKPERKFKKNEYCQSQMKEDLEGTCQWQGGGNLTATRRRELNSDKAEGTWQWQGGGNLTVTRRRELDSDKAEGTWQWQGGGNLAVTRRRELDNDKALYKKYWVNFYKSLPAVIARGSRSSIQGPSEHSLILTKLEPKQNLICNLIPINFCRRAIIVFQLL